MEEHMLAPSGEYAPVADGASELVFRSLAGTLGACGWSMERKACLLERQSSSTAFLKSSRYALCKKQTFHAAFRGTLKTQHLNRNSTSQKI
jgi:hypothetical protein